MEIWQNLEKNATQMMIFLPIENVGRKIMNLLRSTAASLVLIIQNSFEVITYSFVIEIELTKLLIGFRKFNFSLDSLET